MGAHDRKLLCIFPDAGRRQVSVFIAGRVSQATLAPSASRVGTCSDGQWRSGQDLPSAGLHGRGGGGGLAAGPGIPLFSEALL